MTLAFVIADLATGSYTVTRRAADTYDANGVRVLGATSTFAVVACVQPVLGRELQRLPEARRTREAKALWTQTALQAQPVADRVTIDGEAYEVDSVQRWADSGDYYKAIVLKVTT